MNPNQQPAFRLKPEIPASSDQFKTNIGRQKTKKWVEAKAINYDGDDWGSDYGEFAPDEDVLNVSTADAGNTEPSTTVTSSDPTASTNPGKDSVSTTAPTVSGSPALPALARLSGFGDDFLTRSQKTPTHMGSRSPILEPSPMTATQSPTDVSVGSSSSTTVPSTMEAAKSPTDVTKDKSVSPPAHKDSSTATLPEPSPLTSSVNVSASGSSTSLRSPEKDLPKSPIDDSIAKTPDLSAEPLHPPTLFSSSSTMSIPESPVKQSDLLREEIMKTLTQPALHYDGQPLDQTTAGKDETEPLPSLPTGGDTSRPLLQTGSAGSASRTHSRSSSLHKRFSWEVQESKAKETNSEVPSQKDSSSSLDGYASQIGVVDFDEQNLTPLPLSPNRDLSKQNLAEKSEEATTTTVVDSEPESPVVARADREQESEEVTQKEEKEKEKEKVVPREDADHKEHTASENTAPENTAPENTAPKPSNQSRTDLTLIQHLEVPSHTAALEVTDEEERTKLYDQARQEYASIDTGLGQWITEMKNRYPEYAHSTSVFSPINATTIINTHSGQQGVPSEGGVMPLSTTSTGLSTAAAGGPHHQAGLAAVTQASEQVKAKSKVLFGKTKEKGRVLRMKFLASGDKDDARTREHSLRGGAASRPLVSVPYSAHTAASTPIQWLHRRTAHGHSTIASPSPPSSSPPNVEPVTENLGDPALRPHSTPVSTPPRPLLRQQKQQSYQPKTTSLLPFKHTRSKGRTPIHPLSSHPPLDGVERTFSISPSERKIMDRVSGSGPSRSRSQARFRGVKTMAPIRRPHSSLRRKQVVGFWSTREPTADPSSTLLDVSPISPNTTSTPTESREEDQPPTREQTLAGQEGPKDERQDEEHPPQIHLELDTPFHWEDVQFPSRLSVLDEHLLLEERLRLTHPHAEPRAINYDDWKDSGSLPISQPIATRPSSTASLSLPSSVPASILDATSPPMPPPKDTSYVRAAKIAEDLRKLSDTEVSLPPPPPPTIASLFHPPVRGQEQEVPGATPSALSTNGVSTAEGQTSRAVSSLETEEHDVALGLGILPAMSLPPKRRRSLFMPFGGDGSTGSLGERKSPFWGLGSRRVARPAGVREESYDPAAHEEAVVVVEEEEEEETTTFTTFGLTDPSLRQSTFSRRKRDTRIRNSPVMVTSANLVDADPTTPDVSARRRSMDVLQHMFGRGKSQGPSPSQDSKHGAALQKEKQKPTTSQQNHDRPRQDNTTSSRGSDPRDTFPQSSRIVQHAKQGISMPHIPSPIDPPPTDDDLNRIGDDERSDGLPGQTSGTLDSAPAAATAAAIPPMEHHILDSTATTSADTPKAITVEPVVFPTSTAAASTTTTVKKMSVESVSRWWRGLAAGVKRSTMVSVRESEKPAAEDNGKPAMNQDDAAAVDDEPKVKRKKNNVVLSQAEPPGQVKTRAMAQKERLRRRRQHGRPASRTISLTDRGEPTLAPSTQTPTALPNEERVEGEEQVTPPRAIFTFVPYSEHRRLSTMRTQSTRRRTNSLPRPANTSSTTATVGLPDDGKRQRGDALRTGAGGESKQPTFLAANPLLTHTTATAPTATTTTTTATAPLLPLTDLGQPFLAPALIPVYTSTTDAYGQSVTLLPLYVPAPSWDRNSHQALPVVTTHMFAYPLADPSQQVSFRASRPKASRTSPAHSQRHQHHPYPHSPHQEPSSYHHKHRRSRQASARAATDALYSAFSERGSSSGMVQPRQSSKYQHPIYAGYHLKPEALFGRSGSTRKHNSTSLDMVPLPPPRSTLDDGVPSPPKRAHKSKSRNAYMSLAEKKLPSIPSRGNSQRTRTTPTRASMPTPWLTPTRRVTPTFPDVSSGRGSQSSGGGGPRKTGVARGPRGSVRSTRRRVSKTANAYTIGSRRKAAVTPSPLPPDVVDLGGEDDRRPPHHPPVSGNATPGVHEDAHVSDVHPSDRSEVLSRHDYPPSSRSVSPLKTPPGSDSKMDVATGLLDDPTSHGVKDAQSAGEEVLRPSSIAGGGGGGGGGAQSPRRRSMTDMDVPPELFYRRAADDPMQDLSPPVMMAASYPGQEWNPWTSGW